MNKKLYLAYNLLKKVVMPNTNQELLHIPEHYIYEMVNGKPIHYKGYMAYLDGKQPQTELMGSSFLQSLIITNLVLLLHSKLGTDFYILTNELGLQFSKGNWRAADIAIYGKEQLDLSKADNKYLKIPPKVVIEIDTKADPNDIKDTFSYYNEKTEQLINFGVEKVVWIFSDSQKVLIAEKANPSEWRLTEWSKDFDLLGKTININQLLDTL